MVQQNQGNCCKVWYNYWLFPQQYLNLKGLLLNKNGNYINLMRKKEKSDFIIQQSIEFNTYRISIIK
ncbi:unnamed protein product [Paramecium primaurelia]|uniref:Uncharacterized protein n=1 Tax=Paramecium primaurelia TaxID=5886 RepID=A0A8S1QMB5_PARPR|nr:unnamed protein product [Paramecium primaurelia]